MIVMLIQGRSGMKRNGSMSIHNVVEGTQQATLHVVAGGLSITSVAVGIAAAVQYLPAIALVVGIISGCVSITAYTLDILEKPRFKALLKRWSKKP